MIPPPRDPVARSIFDVLDAEQAKRADRPWTESERREEQAVWEKCCALAGRHVELADVRSKMRMASGHIDYPWKVAYYCADLVRGGRP